MMDVTVKTLDGQNRSFNVPEDITVRQFKKRIASSINILPNVQRMIFQGKVLYDEKLLKDYDVHGKVVHVVVRPPPVAGNPPATDNDRPNVTPSRRNFSSYIGANMIQPNEPSVDVQINLRPFHTASAISEVQMRLNTARRMMRLATEALNQLQTQRGRENASRTDSSTTSSTSCPQPSDVRQERERELVSSTSSSPMDTSEVLSESIKLPQTSANRSTPTNQSSEASAANPPNEGTQHGSQTQTSRSAVRTNIGALGEVLVELNDLNRQLQPYMNRFLQIVQADAEMDRNEQRESQLVCDMVSEAMHAISHAYHALSDLMVDFSQNRPRQLSVELAIMHQHSAVIQHAAPVVLGSMEHLRRPTTVGIAQLINMIRSQIGQNVLSTPSTVTPCPIHSDYPSTSSTVMPSSVRIPSSTLSTSSSTSTGTITTSHSTSLETGTQSAQASDQEVPQTTAAVMAFLLEADNDMQTISQQLAQQMSTGLQNMFSQGLQQGDGTTDNQYMFLETGPGSSRNMSVNRLTAEVISAGPDYHSAATEHPSSSPTQSTGTASQPQCGGNPVTRPEPMPLGMMPPNFLPPNIMQQVIQQIARQSVGQLQRMQSHIGPGLSQGALPFMDFELPRRGAAPTGLWFGSRVMNPVPRNEPATQTQTGSGVPSSIATRTLASRMSESVTQTSRTQTTTSPAPRRTSGTSNIATPHVATYAVPGLPVPDQSVNPEDPCLFCSSRHFHTQNARSIIGQRNAQSIETGLNDIVNNFMSGWLRDLQSGSSVSAVQAPTTATGVIGSPQTRSRRLAGPHPTSIQFSALSVSPQRLRSMVSTRVPQMLSSRLRRLPTHQLPPQGLAFRPTARPTAAQPSPVVSVTGSSATAQGLPGGPAQWFRRVLRQTNPQHTPQGDQPNSGSTSTMTGPAAATGNQSEQNANQQSHPITDEMFMQLVNGITSFVSQVAIDQAPRQTFMGSLSGMQRDYGIPSGEGFITDVFSCILSNLQIVDILTIFFGNATPLNQVQRPLKGFLNERVLEWSPPFPENIRRSVERLIETMQPEIQDTVNDCQPGPQIDFLATLNEFFSQQLCNFASLVIDSIDGDQNFGQALYGYFSRMLSELLVLCCRCLGSMAAVERLVANRLQVFMRGVNPFMQNLVGSMTSLQLRRFIPTITVAESEITFYIMYRQMGQLPSSDAVQSMTSPVEVPAATRTTGAKTILAAGIKSDPSSLRETSLKRTSTWANRQGPRPSVPQIETTLPSKDVSGQSEMSSPAGDVHRAESTDITSAPTVVADKQPIPSNNRALTASMPFTGEWQSVVAPEWVPIVAQDIDTQRIEMAESPHSDVYLRGIPPKRRKLMTHERLCDVANAAEMLPESVQRAVTAAGVQPITSMEKIESDIQLDSQLNDAYANQINHALTQRLEEDSDFKDISERFPDAQELFHKKSDSKK